MNLFYIITGIFIITTITLLLKLQKYYLISNNQIIQLKKYAEDLDNLIYSHNLEKDARISAEKEVIIYKQKLEAESKKIADWENSKNEAVSYAKAAVFEVGYQLSNKLLEEHTHQTNEAQKQGQEKIDETSQKLQQQFENIVSLVSGLNSQVKDSKNTVELVKRALLSPTGAGCLAEITLENILKSSGLIQGIDFIMQYSINYSAENQKLRPDAIIFLPSGNVMIIDSKASKFFLEMEMVDISDKEIETKLRNSMRLHLKQLSNKDYKEAVKQNLINNSNFQVKHISNIMFLPSEAALEKIQIIDKEFMQKAWEESIFPAGPISIINILSHAKFMISEDKQLQNHNIIAEEIRKLLLSISVVCEHIKKVGSSIQSAANHYDKLAGSFNSNILTKSKNIQKLGIHLPSNKANVNSLDRYQIISSSDKIIETTIEENTNSLTPPQKEYSGIL